MEEKVAQPSWLWGQRASCPLVLLRSAGSLPAVFGSLPNTISSASCRRGLGGSPRSPESLRYVKLKAVSFKLIDSNRQYSLDRRRTGVDFHLQPTLKGELIELRPLRPQDFNALFAAASDPQIWEQHPESDRYQRKVFQRFFDGALESKGAFAIIERKSGRMIGSSRYCNLDLTNREVEVGWTFLEREFWGGTYNRELKQLMLDHAFRFVDRVLFVVGENNIRSQKALAKIGANFLKKAQLPAADETVRTNVVFVITAKSYRAVEPGAQHQKAVLAETPQKII